MRQFSIGNYGTPAAIGKIADITHAAFLSGAALLDREKGIVLLADSFDGSLYRVDINTSKVFIWFHHRLLEKIRTGIRRVPRSQRRQAPSRLRLPL